MLTCLSDVRNLSLYTLKVHYTCIYIYISLQEHTHTHTRTEKLQEQLPCTADNIWNAATPACAEGQVQTGRRLWGQFLSILRGSPHWKNATLK